jgi:hypothetical protein
MLGTRTLAEPTRSACHAKPGLGPATTSATVRLSRCRSRRSTDQALTQPLAGRRRPRSLVTTARKGLRSQEGGKPRHSSVRESESRLAGEETRRCRPARERATRGSPRPAADNRQRALAAPSGTKRPENRLLDRASKATHVEDDHVLGDSRPANPDPVMPVSSKGPCALVAWRPSGRTRTRDCPRGRPGPGTCRVAPPMHAVLVVSAANRFAPAGPVADHLLGQGGRRKRRVRLRPESGAKISTDHASRLISVARSATAFSVRLARLAVAVPRGALGNVCEDRFRRCP